MDIETLQKKYDRIYQIAFKLRHHQIRFQKYKTSIDWEQARRYAGQLDKLLNDEKELKESLLQELF